MLKLDFFVELGNKLTGFRFRFFAIIKSVRIQFQIGSVTESDRYFQEFYQFCAGEKIQLPANNKFIISE